MTIAADALTVALGGRTVVRGVSAGLSGGALVGVLGPNGAGKSTLVRALLGLVPAAGSVLIDGRTPAALGRSEVARRVAYLPQGQTLHWPLSVERLVALGRLPHLAPLSRMAAADRAAIGRAMDLAGVTDLGSRTATELSGGERARVLLARALAVEAPALIADEPLAGLDPAHALQVMEILHARAAAGGLVIAVLHDLGLAARFCDRLLLMDGGRLVADGGADDVLSPDRLRDVYGITAHYGHADGQRLIVPVARTR